jgi:hypothetical protein
LRDLVVVRSKGVAGLRDRKARLSEKEGPNGNENSLERWNAMISQTLSWTQRFLRLLCFSGKQNVFVFSLKEQSVTKHFEYFRRTCTERITEDDPCTGIHVTKGIPMEIAIAANLFNPSKEQKSNREQ